MLFYGPAAEQRSPHNSWVLIFSWPFLREQTNPPEMERGGVIKLRGREQFVKGLAGTLGFLERRLPSSSAALRCLPLLNASWDIVRRSCRPSTENSATWFLPVCSSRANSSRSSTRVGFLVSDELAIRVGAIDDPADWRWFAVLLFLFIRYFNFGYFNVASLDVRRSEKWKVIN